jgi:hypothetical protein
MSFYHPNYPQKEKIKNKTALGYVSRKRLATLISLLRKRERPHFAGHLSMPRSFLSSGGHQIMHLKEKKK